MAVCLSKGPPGQNMYQSAITGWFQGGSKGPDPYLADAPEEVRV